MTFVIPIAVENAGGEHFVESVGTVVKGFEGGLSGARREFHSDGQWLVRCGHGLEWGRSSGDVGGVEAGDFAVEIESLEGEGAALAPGSAGHLKDGFILGFGDRAMGGEVAVVKGAEGGWGLALADDAAGCAEAVGELGGGAGGESGRGFGAGAFFGVFAVDGELA